MSRSSMIMFLVFCSAVVFAPSSRAQGASKEAAEPKDGEGAELEDPTEEDFHKDQGGLDDSVDATAGADEGGDPEVGEEAHPLPDEASPLPEDVAVPPPLPQLVPPELAADVSANRGALAYADHLFLDGDWYRSIGEYRRYLYLMRGRGPHAPRAAIAIGEALMRGRQWDAAGRQLDGVAQRSSDLLKRRVALFGAARAYLLDGRPELSKPRFRLIAEDEDTAPAMRREATWLLAWGHFDAGEFEKAEEYFAQLAQAEGPHGEAAAGIVAQLQLRPGLSKRNPILAGALSLIPGLGHMYLGQWSVGLTSFGWNALFTFAAVTAWLQGQWGVALVLTVMEVAWYSGGIFGALAGTLRYNRDVIRNWRDQIIAEYGASREMPAMHLFPNRDENPPGAAARFGIPF